MPTYIKEYTPHNDFCDKCKLAKLSSRPFIEGRGNINSKVLVLTDAPTKNDETLGIAYGGDFGRSIEREIINAGIRSYYMSYMVKCFPNGKKLVTPKKCCYPFTIALIKEMKPKVIIAMGRDVLEHLTKVSIDVDVARGKKFYHPELNAIIIATYNPRIFLNDKTDPICKTNFKSDLRFAAQILSEGLPRLFPVKPKSLKDPVEIEAYLNELLVAEEFAFDLETAKLEEEELEVVRTSEESEASEETDKEESEEEKSSDTEAVIEEVVSDESESDSDEDEDLILDAESDEAIDALTEIPPNLKTRKKMSENHDPKKDIITDVSFCMAPGKGVHIKWELLFPTFENLVKQVFASPAKKVGHNGMYDMKFLECVNIPVNNYYFDTMIGYHRLTMSFEGGKASGLYRLKTMDWFLTTSGGYNEVLDEFGGIGAIQKKKKKEIEKAKKAATKKPKKQKPFVAEEMTAEQVISIELQKELEECSNYILNLKKKNMETLGLPALEYYSAMDSDVTFRIYKKLLPEVIEKCSGFFFNIDMPLNETFKDMELQGVRFDRAHMLSIYKSNLKKAVESKKKFFAHCQEEFNIGSTKQLQRIIFKKLGVVPDKKFKTKTGNSTDEKALTAYAQQVPELNYILDYRGYLKANATYITGFNECIDPKTERAYPSFVQIGTATGRIGVRNPALQTMPRDNVMRNMVIPADGYKFVTADLSQAELRIMAQMSGDENMIDAFNRGFDFHTYTACSAILKIPYEEYKGDEKGHPEQKKHKDARSSSKAINFGIVYMIGSRKLSEQIGTSVEEAQGFMDAWFKRYPKVLEWIEKTKHFAIKNGYTETLYGRRRYLPSIYSPDNYTREAAIRQAVNCVDELTEALTNRGWLTYDKINKETDLLLTKNKDTGMLEWQPIEAMSIFPDYEGDVVEFSSKSFSAVTTPHHRWLVDVGHKGNTGVVVSENISVCGSHKIHRVGTYISEIEEFSDDFIKLIGIAITDGHFKKQKTYNTSGITIFQSLRAKPANVQTIDSIFSNLKLKHSRKIREATQCVEWSFFGEEALLIRSICPDRKLSMALLNKLSHRQAKILLDSMLMGDGTVETPKKKTHSGKKVFYTRHEDVAGVFQILCTMCGYASSYRWRGTKHAVLNSPKLSQPITGSKGVFIVSILDRKTAQVVKHQKKVYQSKQLVWCPSVGNTFFVARRKGFVYVTGNTPIQGSANDIAFIALNRMNKFRKERNLDSRLILVVHDEILVETPISEIETIQGKLVEFMTKDIPLLDKIELVADPAVLDRWEK